MKKVLCKNGWHLWWNEQERGARNRLQLQHLECRKTMSDDSSLLELLHAEPADVPVHCCIPEMGMETQPYHFASGWTDLTCLTNIPLVENGYISQMHHSSVSLITLMLPSSLKRVNVDWSDNTISYYSRVQSIYSLANILHFLCAASLISGFLNPRILLLIYLGLGLDSSFFRFTFLPLMQWFYTFLQVFNNGSDRS